MFSTIQPHRNFLLFGSGGKSESDETTPEQPQTGTRAFSINPASSLAADRFEAGETSASNAQPENDPPKNEIGDAQPTLSLEGLPHDLLFNILEKLKISDTYEKFENFHAVRATSRALRDKIEIHPDYKTLKIKVNVAKRMWDREDRKLICGTGFNVDQLHPSVRPVLIDEVLNSPDADRCMDIARLGSQLAAFTPDQRGLLVNAALLFQNDGHKAYAIAGLGSGLEHLEPEQRTTLVNTVLNFQDAVDQSVAIAGLGNGLEHLKPEQRTALLNKVEHFPQAWHKVDAIVGLVAGLQHLTPQQRDGLVNTVLDMENDEEDEYKGKGIAALGSGLAHLTPGYRDKVLQAALNLPTIFQPHAFGGLVAGLHALTPKQRNLLVEATLNLRDTWSKGNLICKFMEKPKDISPKQYNALFQAALKNPEQNHKPGLFSQIVASHLHELTPEQRDALVKVTLQLQNEKSKAKVIRALIKRLGYFTSEQRDALVDASLQLQNEKAKAKIIRLLTLRLQHLTPEQHKDMWQASLNLQNGEYKALGAEWV